MKHIFILMLSLFSNVLFAQQNSIPKPAAEDDENAKKELILLKTEKLRESLLNRDSVALMNLLSDDVTYGHSNGLNQSKEQVVRSVMSAAHDYRKITVRDAKVRLYVQSAVVNMEADVYLLLEGKPLEMNMDILLVWVYRGGDWKLVARQSVRNG